METKYNAESSNCLNCEQPLSQEADFCSACGQKRTTGRVSFQQLFTDFFENLFNIDSRVFLTLRKLVIPGFLTTEYFRGRHKIYLHPFRLFLVALITVVATITWKLNEFIVNEGDILSRVSKARIERTLMLEIDSLNQQSRKSNPTIILHDQLDSLKKQIYQRNGISGDSIDLDHYFTLMGEDFAPIYIDDIFLLNVEELTEKYNIEGFKRKWMFGQKIKVIHDSRSFIRFLIGRISWAGLVLIPLLALGLKLLYWWRGYYYVEHFIFSIHTHTVFFFLTALQLLLIPLLPLWTIAITSSVFILYLALAMYHFYAQSWWKTGIKFSILTLVVYWLCICLSLVVAVLLGVLFF